MRYVGTRAFGVPDPSAVDAWVERAGPEQWRVHEVDGVVEANALRVPMGTFFGGRSVSTLGYAGVATSPEARGSGVGAALMKDTLREAREEGFALSSLNPSTREFYRKLGYALCGDMFEVDLDLAALPEARSSAKVTRFTSERREPVHALYRSVARRRHGALDRGPYVWRRIEDSRHHRVDGYLFEIEGRLEGYAFVALPASSPFFDVLLTDWCVVSPAALDALQAFLRGYRSLAQRVKYTGNAQDILTARTPARTAKVSLSEVHMLRILDVGAALTRRGYSEHVDAALTLRICEDPIFEANVRTYRLRVKDGAAEVTTAPASGAGGLETTIDGLASLYSAYHPPEALARAGALRADAASLEAATQIFAAPRPYLDQMY